MLERAVFAARAPSECYVESLAANKAYDSEYFVKAIVDKWQVRPAMPMRHHWHDRNAKNQRLRGAQRSRDSITTRHICAAIEALLNGASDGSNSNGSGEESDQSKALDLNYVVVSVFRRSRKISKALRGAEKEEALQNLGDHEGVD